MTVEIWIETPKFLFWEYLFQIFGILSLQCLRVKSAQAGEGGGCTPSPFRYFAVTYKVVQCSV
jgi:hypothetical protein